MRAGIKVFAPASVANVACGFDVLGFALDQPGDEILARFSDKKGLVITKITGDGKKLPHALKDNTAGWAAKKYLDHIGMGERGIELEIHKKMPFGSGLGSSAASAAGGVMAVNELMGRPLTKKELLPFAVLGEQVADGAYHADNVAPSLLGGMILIRDTKTLEYHRIPVPPGIFVAVVFPHIQILTKDAREIIKKEVSLDDHIQQSSNLAGLILGFSQSNLDLISQSLRDVIIEPQRAPLIPYFYDVQEEALNRQALGCSISGAGPSIFAIFSNSYLAESGGKAMQNVFIRNGITADLYLSKINQEGTRLL
jgi:homoserine kinase